MSAPLALFLGIALGALFAGAVVGIQMGRRLADARRTNDTYARIFDDANRRHPGDPHNYNGPTAEVNKAKWRRGVMKNVHDPESS